MEFGSFGQNSLELVGKFAAYPSPSRLGLEGMVLDNESIQDLGFKQKLTCVWFGHVWDPNTTRNHCLFYYKKP
jgi:hypothetical protein